MKIVLSGLGRGMWDQGSDTHGFGVIIIPIQKSQIILRFQDLCAKIVGIRDQIFDMYKSTQKNSPRHDPVS